MKSNHVPSDTLNEASWGHSLSMWSTWFPLKTTGSPLAVMDKPNLLWVLSHGWAGISPDQNHSWASLGSCHVCALPAVLRAPFSSTRHGPHSQPGRQPAPSSRGGLNGMGRQQMNVHMGGVAIGFPRQADKKVQCLQFQILQMQMQWSMGENMKERKGGYEVIWKNTAKLERGLDLQPGS